MDENKLYLCDEDGNKYEFDILDTIESDGKKYIVICPSNLSEEDDIDFEILREEPYDDGISYMPEDDTAVCDKIYEIFKNLHPEDFNFDA